MFVVDDVETDIEMQAKWTWCLNNRDGILEYKKVNDASSSRTVARRGNAGLKLFNVDRENIKARAEIFGLIHDAYHPIAGQEGTGKPGSAILAGHSEIANTVGRRHYLFAMAADLYGASAHWHLRPDNALSAELESFGKNERWHINAENPENIIITDRNSNKTWRLTNNSSTWQLISK